MISEDNCCFVLVDVQEKLLSKVHECRKLIENLEIVLKAFNILDLPVIWCQQAPEALSSTVPELKAHLENNTPLNKTSFNCTDSNEFNQKLNELNKENIILSGIESHICIYQTAASLKKMSKNVTVIADAVSSRNPENKKISINAMAEMGIKISSTEILLFELLKTSEHSEFRKISKLIK